MAAAALLLGLALLGPRAAGAGPGACYDGAGRPRRCLPGFENAAFGRRAEASHTCGRPPEDFCPHLGAPGAGPRCQRCDAADPRRRHDAAYLTDFHSQDDSTWWQSPSMALGVQHPTSVNITLRLGKAYEITYVRLKFHTSRPESFAIYKRTRAGGPWEPYQYYSASCQKTYGRPEGQYLRPGDDERVAFCTSEFSDISPLSGGNVAFSTLEGRPSAYNFEESPVLQEWVTSTELLISLDRLNTFGDDIFKDPKVLQSYYYAVSDFSVGGRCKCNGHASECSPDGAGRLACRCQHNTTGTDCERCLPFFQDRPWGRGTAEAANECVPCNCSGHSEECVFDRELFRSTGHGGRCLRCRDHTAGPHCERCQEDFYRWSPRTPCQPCDCHPAGSLRLQCDASGTCICKPTVTGWKCDRCLPGFHSLSEGGCRPCSCSHAGSLGTCDPHSGRCPCKENVEGHVCDRCRPGTFNLQPHNPAGCTSCFCYGHSKVCEAAAQFREHHIISDLRQGAKGWRTGSVGGPEHPAQWGPRGLLLNPEDEEELTLPEKFLGDQRFSYGQPLTLTFLVPPGASPLPVQLRLEGAGLALTLQHSSLSSSLDAEQPGEVQLRFELQETSEDVDPPLPPFHFQRLLTNLTALRIRTSGQSPSPSGQVFLTEVRLTSAQRGLSPTASWVETCSCPKGYTGQFCESCAPGYKREIPLGGPYTNCVPCTCNQHGTCDPHTGICVCDHHTEGPSCERCLPGFYGNPFAGQPDDCQPCPCPGQSACIAIPESSDVVCTHCPLGQRGRRCEICDDGYFGDPLGISGAPEPCRPCQCSGNVDPNAVGNCDSQSGHCLRCLHNTTGAHCERCQDGFYGSALAPRPADRCTPCNCHPEGSVSEQRPCDPVTGQCTCLPHVMGRDCDRCSPSFYDLQPGRGCRSCKCHPLGSQEDQCHPKTGQCPCRPGVEGQACDRCQLGFFGFSIKGCRACRCSPLGAASPQCHKNSTCVCRPGFVGYKCDHCQDNFFLTAGGTHCQECPSCYSLVKEEAAKLKARLTLMEGWLEGTNCGRSWGPLPILQGEAPRGDIYQDYHLLQGAWEVFLEQVTGLKDAVKAAREQLWALSRGASCAQAQTEKTCIQLADLDTVLESSEEEILQAATVLKSLVIPQNGPSQPTTWSHLATEARALARSHKDATAKIKATARRALVASNTSYALLWSLVEGRMALEAQRELEDRYQDVQAAQKALGTAAAEVLPEAEKALATMQRVGVDAAPRLALLAAPMALVLPEPAISLQPQKSQAGALDLKVQALEKTVTSRERVVTEAAWALQATAQAMLHKTQPLMQLRQEARAALTRASSSVQAATVTVMGARTLLADLEGMKRQFPQPKDPATLGRKAGSVRGRLLTDLKKKTKQAERMLGNAASVSASAKKKGQEAETLAKDSAKLAKALLREGKQEHRRAGRLSSQVQTTLRQASQQVLASGDRRQELEAAGQVGARLNAVEQQIWESRTSLEKDVKVLSELLARLGSLDTHQAPVQALNETQWALERLRLQLSPPGALQGKLRLLEQESEQQELQIQSFENDLAEIRADKQNLEAILQSLPKSCASWQ
ncbi:laminin subunit gamma-3 isoform X1 [Canis lupus familiaris]|uniref:laminin subunit gamma-3 isoform X1 n=1 Tax=Canis lupus familiaris TaxID=9615 RepID=UPI0018F28E1E|nr:laminin subunit gamma-3 isoform X1 [Canis lupus familiaris]